MTRLRTHAAAKLAGLAALAAVAGCASVATSAQPATSKPAVLSTAADSYFPPIVSRETPEIRFTPMRDAGPQERQVLVDQINLVTSGGERRLPIVAQAVDDERKTLVLMDVEAQAALTSYIARAKLARMTSLVRFLPAIAEMGLSGEFDIYNMGAVLGFSRIVMTDGRSFSHEAVLTPAPDPS